MTDVKRQDSDMLSPADPGEEGVVIIITVGIVSVFFIVMLYAIELSSLLASLGQQQYHARFVVLSALEEYFDTECASTDVDECHAERMAKAVDRAQGIAGYNVVLKSGRGETVGGASSIADEEHVVLESGRWYSVDDDSGACEGIDKTYPCFVPGTRDVNSFNLAGQIYEPAFFLSITSDLINSFPLDVDVTASVIPRHGCFLVDLSGSTQRTTHLLEPNAAAAPEIPASEFAFYLAEDGNAVPSPNQHQKIWDRLDADRVDGVSTDTAMHYRSDYELKSSLNDANYGDDARFATYHPDPNEYSAARKTGNYKVDFFRDADHLGPEPLTTIFAGLHEAVSLLSDRAVAGDKACIIFYDQELTWTRIVNLTDDFDYLKALVNPAQLKVPKNEAYGYRINSLDEAPPVVRHFLFPTLGGYTFTQLALAEAMSQLNSGKEEVGSVANFLVHIGDGLANCSATCDALDQDGDGEVPQEDLQEMLEDCAEAIMADALDFPLDVGSDSSLSSDLVEACGKIDTSGDGELTDDEFFEAAFEIGPGCSVCSNRVSQYRIAYGEIMETVEGTLFTGKIPMHVILVGDHVQPHTLDIEDEESGKCLSDADARQQELDFTDGIYDHWRNNSSSNSGYENLQSTFNGMFRQGDPFYQVNYDWYRIARMTGGFWGPIRPKHPDCLGGDTALSETCSDGERRVYDHECRTTEKQIKDYMKLIMEQNPFAVVGSR